MTAPQLMLPTIDGMHPSLARLLRLARQATASNTRPVQTLQQLREMLGLSPQLINAWKTRGVSKQGAIDAARVIGCSANGILDDDGNETSWLKPQPLGPGAQPRGLMIQEPGMRSYMVAPVFEWEQIMQVNPLPPDFEVVLLDDAMAPLAPKGTKVRFTTRRAASPGDAVLVADQAGTLYFRVYHAGLNGEWDARPSNTYYPALASANGLRVLAVFAGIEAAWAQLSR